MINPATIREPEQELEPALNDPLSFPSPKTSGENDISWLTGTTAVLVLWYTVQDQFYYWYRVEA